MSSRIGTRFTQQQARTLGATKTFQPFGTQRGNGIWSSGTGEDPTHTKTGTELTWGSISGSSDEQWSSFHPISNTFDSGQVVIYTAWEANQSPGNLTNDVNIGVIWRGLGASFIAEDRAVFRPSAGQNTDGNVRVMRATTTTTGQVTYPTITDGAIFTNVLIDQDRGQTEFYVQKNPLTEQPDETISTTPEFLRSFGGLIAGSDTSETVRLTLVGFIYIP